MHAALARRILAGASLDDLERELAPGSPEARLFATRKDLLANMARMVASAGVDHATAVSARDIAAMFDRAVAVAPDASVAAYTLGDADLLTRATDEIVTWLHAQRLLAAHTRVLDLGCGTGRVAAALAPRVAFVLGLDASSGMIAEARARHSDVANLRFEHTNGSPPEHLPPRSFQLVVAVDSYPYLVQSGIEQSVTHCIARLLTPDGALAILNLAYSADESSQSKLAQELADENNLNLAAAGTTPFRLWDGRAYLFRARPNCDHKTDTVIDNQRTSASDFHSGQNTSPYEG
jgi:SAM-dependent methyltransferase